jgi:hypothetical protein
MESFDEPTKSASSKMGFFKQVFNFEDESKAEIMNIIQYSLLAVIPVVILNKLSQKYVPEADEEKGTFEILAEVIIQILVIFFGLMIINRIVCYVPTYSGVKYPDVNVIAIILPILTITTSLQTKLGEKVGILTDRVTELWDGSSKEDNKKGKSKSKGNVKVSQPISGQSQGQGQVQNNMQSQMNAISQSLYSTPISQLPTSSPEQSSPDFNAMYQNTYTPMPGAATPGEGFQNGGGFNEPMAANAGGSAFGSAFGGGF